MIKLLIKELWHGAFWKTGALVAKGWFLFGVFPTLPSGTLGEYMFFVTVGLLGGRIASLGLEEQLPLVVKGASARVKIWSPLYCTAIAAVLAATFIAVLVSGKWIGAILLVTSYTAYNILIGIVRTVKPSTFEVLANLHAIIFSIFATTPIWIDTTQLLHFFSASLLCAQLVALRAIGPEMFGAFQILTTVAPVRSVVKAGLQKLASNVVLYLSMRGIILFPKVFLDRIPSDSLAFAVALGEATWQFGMVVVNRSFARFCGTNFDFRTLCREVQARVSLLCVVFLTLGLVAFSEILEQFWPSSVDWRQVGVLLAMYGPISGFLLIRYAHWAMDQTAERLIWLLGLWLLTQILLTGYLPEAVWAPGIAIGSYLVLAASAASLRAAMRYRLRE